MQVPHTRPQPQPWQIAHWLGQRRKPGRKGNRRRGTAINILPAMPQPENRARRSIDPQAVATVLRRLGRQPQPPWLHEEVARRMAQRLPLVRLQPEAVVDWSAFLGAGLPLLAKAYPHAQLTAVEPQAGLQARSAALLQAPWWSARRWRGLPARAVLDTTPLAAGVRAQLLWSNMALHGVVDPPALIRRWHEVLDTEGFVMFSCFGPDTARELRTLYAPTGRPPGIDFVDMHDLGDMLVQAGFADPVMDQETIVLEWATPAALLAELRSLGGNVSCNRPPGLRTPRWRAALAHELQALRTPQGRLALSFEITYGHAFKVAPRPAVPRETRVSLDAMREKARAAKSGR